MENAGQSCKSSRISLQGRGAVLGGVGLALLAVGLWRVDGHLTALGLAAVMLLALSGFLAWCHGAAVTLDLELPERVEAGRIFGARLMLMNQSAWLDAFGLRFEVDLAQGASIVGRVPWLTAGSKATIDQRVSIPQRGVRNDFRGLLIADAPFGFFEVKRSFILDGRVVVLPRPMFPRGLEVSGGAMDMRDEDSAAAGGGPGELRGLRPWQAGDSVKHVTWPATLRAMARGAGWVVWECDPPRHRPAKFVLVIHSFGGDRGLIQPERFERALSFAAGILRRLHGHGILVRMLADFDDWRSRPVARGGQMAECLELLAAAKRAAGTEAHDLQAALRTVQQDECVIVLSDMHPSGWKSFLPTSVKHALTPELGGRRTRKEAVS